MARVITVDIRTDGPDGLTAPAVTLIDCKPTRLREDGTHIVLPTGFDEPKEILDGVGTITLEETGPEWAWWVQIIPEIGGKRRSGRWSWYMQVPEGVDPVNLKDLPVIDPKTLDPIADPEAAWWATVEGIQIGQINPDVLGVMVDDEIDAKVLPAVATDIATPGTPIQTALNAQSVESVGKRGIVPPNLFAASQVSNLAFTATEVVEHSTYVGFVLPVTPGDAYSISRANTLNNRFRLSFTGQTPALGVATFGLLSDDAAIQFQYVIVPAGATHMMLYLSNEGGELPEIKVEKGPTVTPWVPNREDELKEAVDENPRVVLTVIPDPAAPAASINAAIASLPAEGGILRIHSGAYTLESGSLLTVDRPVKLLGEGAVSIAHNGNVFAVASDDIQLEGIAFYGNNTGFLRSGAFGGNHSGFILRDCTLANFSLNLTKRGRVTTSGTTVADGVGVGAGVILDRTTFRDYTGAYTIHVAGPRDTVIDKCHIHDVGTDVNIGDAIKVTDDSTGTRIVNCTIERPTRDGMDLYASSGNYVSGNIIRNPGAKGIDQKWQIDDARETGRDTIIGNHVYDSLDVAFSVKAFDCLVANNTSHNSGGAAAFLMSGDGGTNTQKTPRVQLIGNVATDSAGDGYLLRNSDSVAVVGNTASGSGGNGMTVGNDTSRFTIMGNILVNNTGADLSLLTGPITHFILGNQMDDVSPGNGMVIPNNTSQWVYHGNGSRIQWFRMSAAGGLSLGHSGLATLSLSAGTRVDINTALKVSGNVGFYGAATTAQPILTYSKATETPAEAQLRAALVALGLVADSTVA